MAPGPNFKEKLAGQKALVIGGTRGIGLGVAEAFVSSGAAVHILGRTQENVDKALKILREEYPDAPRDSITGGTTDVLKEDIITETLKALAPVDHIVYTAVDDRIRGGVADINIENAQYLFGVKFWGQVAVAKAIARYGLINPGGSYTITSGTLSLRPKPGTAVGGALNAAVNSLAKGLAIDLAPHKVRVNAVIPGFVSDVHETPSPARAAFYEKAKDRLLTGFVGTTEDIAEAYLYFARAKYTTGTLSVVDGGALLSD